MSCGSRKSFPRFPMQTCEYLNIQRSNKMSVRWFDESIHTYIQLWYVYIYIYTIMICIYIQIYIYICIISYQVGWRVRWCDKSPVSIHTYIQLWYMYIYICIYIFLYMYISFSVSLAYQVGLRVRWCGSPLYACACVYMVHIYVQ
jgi:hypothetical protein